jgi:Leucine-rich repeat (LRR) protein
MPPIVYGAISLNKKDLTSLAGVEELAPPEVMQLYLFRNYITDYYDPYLDPYVYYVVNNMTKRGTIEPFRGFENLKILQLNNNQLRELPVGIFNGLGNLISFNLERNQSRGLPVGIFNGLGNLMYLYLANNQLRELPVGIFNGLGNLMYLYLNNNQLRELPIGIFNGLGNLKELYLKNNHLSGTVDEFKNAHGLSRAVFMDFYPQGKIRTQRHQRKGMFSTLSTCPPIHRYPCRC